jgi:transcriptional regulator with XRE-family HTH domain
VQASDQWLNEIVNETQEFRATPLADVISARVRSLRALMRLKQSDVANRMQALGFRWHIQTLSQVERGVRSLSFEEAVALAICLDSTPEVLLQPVTPAVTFPSGVTISAQRLSAIDGSVTWDGSQPVTADSRMPMPEARIGALHDRADHLEDIGHGEEAGELRDQGDKIAGYARYLRRKARQEPAAEPPEPGEHIQGAEDILPRRRKGEDQR